MIQMFENFQGDDTWRFLNQAEKKLNKLTSEVKNTIEDLLSYPELEHDGAVEFRFTVQVEEDNLNTEGIMIFTQTVEGFDLENEEFIVEGNKYQIWQLIDWMPNLSELIFAAKVIYRAVEKTYGYQKYMIEQGREHQLDLKNLHEDIEAEYPHLRGGKRTGIL